ncbi:unnamed protein product, partial [Meganyctiphanes norvegica]
DCPDGYWRVEGSRQCFKLWKDNGRIWAQARTKCEDENSVVAAPADDIAVALRQLILDKYDDVVYGVWLDGKAQAGRSGQEMVWQRHQTELSPDNSLWKEGAQQRLNGGEDRCLLMWTREWVLTDYPTQPYYPALCMTTRAILCEAIIE